MIRLANKKSNDSKLSFKIIMQGTECVLIMTMTSLYSLTGGESDLLSIRSLLKKVVFHRGLGFHYRIGVKIIVFLEDMNRIMLLHSHTFALI